MTLDKLAQQVATIRTLFTEDEPIRDEAARLLRSLAEAEKAIPELRVYAIPEGPMVSYDAAYELRTALIAARAENAELRKDAERYSLLFKDTWKDGKGVAVFSYVRSHDDYERLSMLETNAHLKRLTHKGERA